MNCHNMVQLFLAVCCIVAAASELLTNPGIHHFKVGSLQATVLYDGPLAIPNATTIFSAPSYAVERSLRKNFRSTSHGAFSQNILLVKTTGGYILVDAGSHMLTIPGFQDGGRLFTALSAAGVHTNEINAVVLTHAHVDHVAGLLNKDGRAAFPNAHIFISEVDHKFWFRAPLPYPTQNLDNQSVILFSKTYRRSVRPYMDRLVLVPENGSPLPGVRFISTPGHSPGHSAIEIDGGSDEKLMVTGDTWVTMSDQVQNPDWALFVETDQEEAFRSRVKLLSRLARTRTLTLSYHEQFPGLGYIIERGPFFDWQTASVYSVNKCMGSSC